MAREPKYHREVVAALEAIGEPRLGELVRLDRRSELTHLGIRSPALRKVVKSGFSFYELPEREILEVWDALWHFTPYGDVMFAALEYYLPRVRKDASADIWSVVQHWSGRVDNWAHSDMLCKVYSWILASHHDQVYPQLEDWNTREEEWLRRISIVSLIHYTGKTAVFLPLSDVLPLVSNCLDDHRYYVEKAVGWVLREIGHTHPREVRAYLSDHAPEMSASAFARAIERRRPEERAALRELRRQALAQEPIG